MNKIKARELRNNPTDAEGTLWRRLRLRQLAGLKFRRQQSIGNYIVDFVCLDKRLIVEVDGGHHAQQACRDSIRDSWLRTQKFKVLRFWDNEVLNETDAVLQAILNVLDCPPHLNPPPQGERSAKRE